MISEKNAIFVVRSSGPVWAELTRADMESLGFYVSAADLEDELIRSLGVEIVLAVVAAHGILGSSAFFRDSQNGATAIRRRSFDAGWAQPRGGNNCTQSCW
jgi:hypothetical protein